LVGVTRDTDEGTETHNMHKGKKSDISIRQEDAKRKGINGDRGGEKI